MFTTLRQKIILGIYVLLVISIPIGAYIVSEKQTQDIKTSAKEQTIKKADTITHLSPAEELKQNSLTINPPKGTPEPTPALALTFGPTLSLKLILEGRPIDNQAGKVFIGIAAGTPTNTPNYLLSFTIDLPKNGIFEGLSLAGLTENSQYTAYIKGSAQIASSSAFIMSPSITNLNNGSIITLTTGDLNEDNVINSADYSIIKNAIGTTPTSSNWNENLDLNKDGIVNVIDLGIVSKNLNRTGNSGVWQSSPTTAPSGSPQGGQQPSASASGGYQQAVTGGYWLWVP